MPSQPAAKQITGASRTQPIVITTDSAHGLQDGAEVKISDVGGNVSANGTFFVKTTGLPGNQCSLFSDNKLQTAAQGSGDYTSGGVLALPAPSDYAVLIAINQYPAFDPLHGPERDAELFREWLISPVGGALATSKVTTIFSRNPQATTPADAEPTFDQVKKAFRGFWEQLLSKNGRKIGRRLYLFFSGHGITPAKAQLANLDDAALLMADSTKTILDGHVLGAAWADRFRNAGAFDEILLFMDCCRDLEDNVPPTGPPFEPAIISDRRDQVKFFYARAAQLASKAFEQDLGSPPVRRGVFSFALINGLNDPNVCDSQGRLTTAVLANHLRTEVLKLRPDQPPVIPPVSPESEIVLLQRPAAEPNVMLTFDAALHGQTAQLFEAAKPDQSFAEHVINEESWQLRLNRSFYKVRVSGDSRDRFFDSKPGSGEEVKHVLIS